MIRGRKVGPVLATALVASNMIGSGIFLLPATLATVGSITILGWIVATLGALLVAAVLSRLGQVSPQPGGPCAYAGDALGPFAGFQSTMLYWVCCWVGNIAIAVAAIGYLTSLVPAIAPPLYGAVATAALIWLMTLANILGPRLVCQFESAAIVIGLIPILLVGTAGWLYFDADIFAASWNVRGEPVMSVLPQSLVLVFWAFLGLESASVAAAVVENPRRNVAIATIGGVLLAGAVYIASCSVVMGLIPAAQLAKSGAPFADAVRVVLGPVGGATVALMALIKATATLAGWVMMTAQIGKAGADRGWFPAVLGRVDSAGIPVRSLLIMAAMMTGVVFATMAPTLGQQFGTLIEVSVLLSLLVYLFACTAVWRYEAPDATLFARRRDRVLAIAAMAFCLCVIAWSDARLLGWAAAVLLLTYPLYPLFLRGQRRAAAAGRAER